LMSASIPLTLKDGESKAQDLKIAGGSLRSGSAF